MSDQEKDIQNNQEDTKDTKNQYSNYSDDQSGEEGRDHSSRRSSNYSGSSRDDDSKDSDDSGRRGRSYRKSKPFFRKKIDKIKAQNLTIDYKHPEILQRFVTNRGKILPRRITGTSAKNQRKLVREIKKARIMAFLPFG